MEEEITIQQVLQGWWFGVTLKSMSELEQLADRVRNLEQRNHRVEGDKAWETSVLRRLLIVSFTYSSVLVYSIAVGVRYLWLNALIPAAGFFLSTLTFPVVKRWWLARRTRQHLR